jgi:hypothetical protein
MSSHTPDKWVIVRATSKEHPQIDKVLGSWYGGYGGADEWRLSSGITKIEPKLTDKYPHYLIHNHSGSVYTCYVNNVGMSFYVRSVAENLFTQLEESGLGMMRVIDIQDVIEESLRL